MYVVAGVTGNTGSVVAESLLSRGKPVRVLVRDAAKGEAWKKRGAEVAVGSVDDAASLRKALEGAKALYSLIPPDLSSPDPLGRARKIVDAHVAALEGTALEQVVFLSSIGAQHATGTGVVRTVHIAEERLRKQRIPTTFVRAASFAENWGSVLPVAQKDGVLPSFERLDVVFSQVATRDIGETAAKALLEPSSSHRVIELAGPVDLSPGDVAATVGKILGRPIQAVHVAGDAIVSTLTSFGISQATAELFRELVEGIDRGHVAFEGTPIRGTTTVESVLRTLLQRA